MRRVNQKDVQKNTILFLRVQIVPQVNTNQNLILFFYIFANNFLSIRDNLCVLADTNPCYDMINEKRWKARETEYEI